MESKVFFNPLLFVRFCQLLIMVSSCFILKVLCPLGIPLRFFARWCFTAASRCLHPCAAYLQCPLPLCVRHRLADFLLLCSQQLTAWANPWGALPPQGVFTTAADHYSSFPFSLSPSFCSSKTLNWVERQCWKIARHWVLTVFCCASWVYVVSWKPNLYCKAPEYLPPDSFLAPVWM